MSKPRNPKIHNVRFYKPKPNAVYCMALQPQGNKLAVSRADASVEIWNLTHCAFIERTIASSTENFSIEGLAWCDDRLFSVGLHGLLIEYDLMKLDLKSRSVVTGEAAFCLDVNKEKTQIAIGTEQGYLNIFQITEDEVLFEKFLDKQEGRILCLKFDNSGEFIVSGSMDAIRIWSVKTNQALHKMIPGRAEHNKPTIVWCLAITQDFTVISGDSRGILTVWDGKVGAQLESYQSHRADILSLCLSEDENSLYCAGIDPNVVNYVRIEVKDGAHKWVRSIQRKIHDHDVRALVLNGNKLYSSGVDGYLTCSYHPPKTLLKYPPILQNPCVTICAKGRYVMLRYPKLIEIWSLGEIGSDRDKHTGLYNVEKAPRKLVALQKVVTDDEGVEKHEGIICSTISDDGTLILYSTRLGVRLLKLDCGESTPKLVPIETDGLGVSPCVSAKFTKNNRLILAPNSGGLQVVAISSCNAVLMQNINTETEIEDMIVLLAVSDSAQFLVGGDVRGNIAVWTLKNDQYVFHCKLPKYKLSPTAIAIQPNSANLVVAFNNNNIIEYDMNRRELTKFSRSLAKNLPKQLTSRVSPIRNITFDSRVKDVIILHDDDSVLVVDKEKPTKMDDHIQQRT
ncbi:U3 small nucleolar RNA-associated protein 4 homolog isoform X2 [Tribolium castaneum]|uniref:U3 small nucleolar RNA-associated protein 4 homolog isoform X2 n=1 Tax=Tribolium castaneum TaxID=7070 RepID=UPI00077DEE4E|nr:PREDICTED: cirhin isoform X2 [Tribolium castaneum]|eukprot:XP_015832958.1 PREDICTED: cirhin isoform X2 [Tribolium castaneum]